MSEKTLVHGAVADLLDDLPRLCQEKRQRQGLSLRTAADQIDGVSFNTLTRFEHGASNCRIDHVMAILRWTGEDR